jgi:hypothetical protein
VNPLITVAPFTYNFNVSQLVGGFDNKAGMFDIANRRAGRKINGDVASHHGVAINFGVVIFLKNYSNVGESYFSPSRTKRQTVAVIGIAGANIPTHGLRVLLI